MLPQSLLVQDLGAEKGPVTHSVAEMLQTTQLILLDAQVSASQQAMELYRTMGFWFALGCSKSHQLEQFYPLESKKILHLSQWSMQVLGSTAK